MWRPHDNWRHTLRRRFSAGLALAAYLMVTIGFPFPNRFAQEGSSAVSCQRQACSCCAAANGTGPCCCYRSAVPPVAAAPASCCASHAANPAPAESSCCSHKSAAPKEPANNSAQPSPASAAAQAGTTWVLGVSAFRCHGMSEIWLAQATQFLPPPAPTWTPATDARPWLRAADVFPDPSSSSPLDPPPRPFSI
jgi:hypothetical protein